MPLGAPHGCRRWDASSLLWLRHKEGILLWTFCSDRNQDLEHHGPFGDKDKPQRQYGQDNPESAWKGAEEELCHTLLCFNSGSNSNGWFFRRWVSLIWIKMRCVRY